MASVSVIGMGAVSAAGKGVDTGFDAVVNGKDCLSPLSLFESGLKDIPPCGQVQDVPTFFGKSKKAVNRTTALAMLAVQEALQGAMERKSLKLGMVLATTVAGMTDSEIFYQEYRNNPDYIKNGRTLLHFHEPTAITGSLASAFQAHSFLTLSTACSTSLHAIGIAKGFIEDTTFDLCLAIGVDALSILTLRGFASLMLIDFTGCKPFDKNRKGISLGEGAGALLLASEKAIDVLKVKAIGKISGWGASADCYHMTAPHPEGTGAVQAAKIALKDADLQPRDITMIATHGTGTQDNDISEIKAMKTIFDPLPPLCSMKGTLGHTLAASGVLESVFALRTMQANCIPSTAGFSQKDPVIDVEPSRKTNTPLQHILKNAFGFGGNNGSIIISKVP